MVQSGRVGPGSADAPIGLGGGFVPPPILPPSDASSSSSSSSSIPSSVTRPGDRKGDGSDEDTRVEEGGLEAGRLDCDGRLGPAAIDAYSKCTHIQRLRNGIKRTQKGWQQWDHFDRVFGVWRLSDDCDKVSDDRDEDGGGADDTCAEGNEVYENKRGENQGQVRRIDIVVVPFIEWPFALLSWTGSKMFNRLIRRFANLQGLSLSAHGLLTVPHHPISQQLRSRSSSSSSSSSSVRPQQPQGPKKGTYAPFAARPTPPSSPLPSLSCSSSSSQPVAHGNSDHEHSAEPKLIPYQTGKDPLGMRPVRTERDVLALIGLPWLPPHLRNA